MVRWQLPKFILEADGTDEGSQFENRQIRFLHKTDAMGINTVEEFEPLGLGMLRKTFKFPIWPIGPLLAPANRPSSSKFEDETTIMTFLDSQPAASVLYISFGSQNSIQHEQMMHLAQGLEGSSCSFIWVIRPPIGYDPRGVFRDEWLPHGFKDRIKQKNIGLLVHGWAPQLKILSHISTGAFLSHCGWNSILESISNGVPIIGWPLAAEQIFNSMMLIEVGLGIELARGMTESSGPTKSKVEEVVDLMMGPNAKGMEFRRRAKEYGNVMNKAWDEEGGSSKENFLQLLANRLQPHIDELLHISQTGFTKGRQITEGFLYAKEIMQFAKNTKLPLGIFKADIHKAFDTIGWNFIQQVMTALRFPAKCNQWINDLVFQGTSQVIINGLIGKKIKLKRGVGQGDPLSPLLFILAIDFLPRWLKKLTANGALRMPVEGMHPCLLYADDAIFFVKSELQQIQILKLVLSAFKLISGLMVSMNKSEMIVINERNIRQMLAVMGCKQETLPLTYLGLPLTTGKLNREAYRPLLEKINKRLAGWTAKFLTIAGRIVLMNSILTTIPIYFMSVFRLPQWLVEVIEKIRRDFLWQGATEQRKIHLANWEMVTLPKKMGGLGIIGIRNFNNALLAKWVWQWNTPTRRLWKSIFQALYCQQEN